jgi:glutathione synthase/RimK-type ligase-like ATP-grasp enzyme
VHFKYGDLVDKLAQYKWFQQQGLSALEFTTDPIVAVGWKDDGHTVFGRKLLNASCGDGIVVFNQGEQPQILATPCPVYTKYKPKKREFRVHVFKDKVVTIVEKRRKTDWNGDKSDTKIRNLANGYIFCQEVELTDVLRKRIEEMALKASKVCSSDFRGVDIGYNQKNDDVFVIEVNSAPGIEGSNVGKYVEAMKTYV